MKNLLAIFVVITTSVIFGFGQNATEKTVICTNDTVEKISSRGIKIGSKLDDILNLFASTEEEKQRIRNSASGPKRTKVGYEFFSAQPKLNDEKFVGISNYTFEFLDNRLAGFSVGYAKPKWKDVSQFTEKLAEIFNLPNVENWNTQPSGTKSIQCENYLVSTQVLK